MEEIRNKNLAFFMEIGGSLKRWNEIGILDRETSLYNLLAEKFNRIYLITYGDNSELKYQEKLRDNIKILTRKKYTENPFLNLIYEISIPFLFRNSLKNCSFLKTNQNTGALAPTISKLLNPKSKLIIRGGYIGTLNASLSGFPLHIRIYLFIEEFFSYLFCEKAITTTKENKEVLLKKYRFLRDKVTVLGNFIDTDKFKKIKKEKEYDIIYVARFHKDKNHLALLETLRETNLKILFIGEGEEKDRVAEYSKTISPRVEILERIPNEKLAEYYNKSKVFVFPSSHEGNPKTLLEAMSCELPVIGFNVLGVKNIIQDEINGIIVQEKDFELMQNKIFELINNERRKMGIGKNARNFIINNFSLKKMIGKELDIYKEL